MVRTFCFMSLFLCIRDTLDIAPRGAGASFGSAAIEMISTAKSASATNAAPIISRCNDCDCHGLAHCVSSKCGGGEIGNDLPSRTLNLELRNDLAKDEPPQGIVGLRERVSVAGRRSRKRASANEWRVLIEDIVDP